MSNTQDQVNELVHSFFGINATEVLNKTAREASMEKMEIYRDQNEIGRAQLYAVEVTENEQLKRQIIEFSQEFIVTIRSFEVYDYVPATYKRETMRFFNSHFPTFDKNAANALGQHLKKSIEYIKSIPGAVLQRGRYEHLSNDVMKRLIERSRNKFFKKVKVDTKLRDLFKARLDKYCELIWLMIMQDEGTIYTDMPLADKVAKLTKHAEESVEEFLNDRCKVYKAAKTLADDVYKAYEVWVTDRSVEMVGKKHFIETVFKVLPFTHQTIESGKTYIRGIKIA